MSGEERPGTSSRSEQLWVPDNPDGSGWALVNWVSVAEGSRYHYCHGADRDTAQTELPPFYRVVTRLESTDLEPHENTYFIPNDRLADFLAEITLAGGAETLWHIEPEFDPPPESQAQRLR